MQTHASNARIFGCVAGASWYASTESWFDRMAELSDTTDISDSNPAVWLKAVGDWSERPRESMLYTFENFFVEGSQPDLLPFCDVFDTSYRMFFDPPRGRKALFGSVSEEMAMRAYHTRPTASP